jgi:NAD(P)-dependent dehydrogenase (short-subunit alcohol dehydrogenase family)
MAKAALNMFTRTCGKNYIKENIVLICVDTGWNNSQYPDSYDIQTPVDCVDGASRILDPIFRNLIKHSILYKDFVIHDF